VEVTLELKAAVLTVKVTVTKRSQAHLIPVNLGLRVNLVVLEQNHLPLLGREILQTRRATLKLPMTRK